MVTAHSEFTARYSAFDDVPVDIPLPSRDRHSAFHRPGHLQDFDGQPLNEHREATVGFGPSDRNRLDSLCCTLDPRDTVCGDGLELAGIQMLPLALCSMVLEWEFLITVWSAERRASWVNDLDSNFLGGCFERYVGDLPQRTQAKEVLVEFSALYLAGLSHEILPLPTEFPVGPRKRRDLSHTQGLNVSRRCCGRQLQDVSPDVSRWSTGRAECDHRRTNDRFAGQNL